MIREKGELVHKLLVLLAELSWVHQAASLLFIQVLSVPVLFLPRGSAEQHEAESSTLPTKRARELRILLNYNLQ